ncbi:hypothetical protein [Mycobacterium sp. TY814]|uniref:hypothetical protein n=1 Tax=unclassified Mycobacterium TaxID=2642494 RepID=UPI0027412E03|nr:hypothetical protein [Mycobacterium sp. TY814]MDP7723616.1 hypothetical protein [Mycobacterium sp. TY814]
MVISTTTDIVLFDAPGPMVPVYPGRTSAAHIDELGSVEISFAELVVPSTT